MSVMEFQVYFNVCLLLDAEWVKQYIAGVINNYIVSAKPNQIPEDFPEKTYKVKLILRFFFLLNPEQLLRLLKLIKGLFEAKVLSQLSEDTTGKLYYIYKINKYCYI